jgi:signal transduction histidine kinase
MSAQTEIHQHQEPISVSSDVLARLGEELITNHVQALAELIKNAYDADATTVDVVIDTTKMVKAPDGKVRRGLITVADNGFGMDETTVRRGWLRVSASPKREMKAAGKKTPKKRTPLGDKGLGRLGAQRLGDRVRIRTRPQPEQGGATGEAYIEHDVAFAFSDFASELDVTQIRVPWITYDLPGQTDVTEPWPVRRKATGTVIEISGLSNLADWADHLELERSLSLLVNPFKGLERFSVAVRVDGNDLNLQSVANQVRDAALIRWEGTFDGETVSLDGTVRLQWFNTREKDMRTILRDLTDTDKGTGLRSFVLDAAKDEPFTVTAGNGPWLLKLHREFRLDELDLTGLALEEDVLDVDADEAPALDDSGAVSAGSTDPAKPVAPRVPTSPGEFLLELDVISRRIGVARASGFSALDKQATYTAWLNERGGVYVYRDGFRVNLGTDVMSLGEAFSSSSSYYGLRPANVIGYIEISAEHNRGLEETTDREGFRETPEVLSFRRLIFEIRDEINDVLDVLGRSTNGYIRTQMAPDGETTEQLAEDLSEAAAQADSARAAVASARASFQSAYASPESDTATRDSALRQGDEALAAADTALEKMEKADRLGAVVRQDVDELTERVEDFAQLIGLGLVAETLAHELNHVSARLSGQVTELQSRPDLEPWARTYLQDTRSALDALHNQLRHLDPMLRYARTRREQIPLDRFALEMAAYHRQRLRAKRISIDVQSAHPATVQANRGRLMQVFDNVVINAEYWLEQAIRASRVAHARIEVEVLGASFSVRDNGPGVDKSLERTIFNPFVTAKADRGRGLGLFICRQLLDLDGGRIQLGEHRNVEGRADTFEIYFDSEDDSTAVLQ